MKFFLLKHRVLTSYRASLPFCSNTGIGIGMLIPDTIGWKNTSEIVQMKEGMEYAAVAIVVHNNKIVIQKRSSVEGDPWSGQFSLPGGHFAKEDEILKKTAIREMKEETGVDLERNSKYLGHFGPFTPRNRQNMEVYAYVFRVPQQVLLITSTESEFLTWVDVTELQFTKGNFGLSFVVNNGIIWGLTARILEQFLELCNANTG